MSGQGNIKRIWLTAAAVVISASLAFGSGAPVLAAEGVVKSPITEVSQLKAGPFKLSEELEYSFKDKELNAPELVDNGGVVVLSMCRGTTVKVSYTGSKDIKPVYARCVYQTAVRNNLAPYADGINLYADSVGLDAVIYNVVDSNGKTLSQFSIVVNVLPENSKMNEAALDANIKAVLNKLPMDSVSIAKVEKTQVVNKKLQEELAKQEAEKKLQEEQAKAKQEAEKKKQEELAKQQAEQKAQQAQQVAVQQAQQQSQQQAQPQAGQGLTQEQLMYAIWLDADDGLSEAELTTKYGAQAVEQYFAWMNGTPSSSSSSSSSGSSSTSVDSSKELSSYEFAMLMLDAINAERAKYGNPPMEYRQDISDQLIENYNRVGGAKGAMSVSSGICITGSKDFDTITSKRISATIGGLYDSNTCIRAITSPDYEYFGATIITKPDGKKFTALGCCRYTRYQTEEEAIAAGEWEDPFEGIDMDW